MKKESRFLVQKKIWWGKSKKGGPDQTQTMLALRANKGKINTPTKLVDLIREWSTYMDSGARDEQKEYLHRTFSSTRTSVAANDPILPCKFPLNWENPNMDR